ncbi:MAG TPA: Na+/H+ antiporter NhaA, partial [Spirochaetota bacterium]|nr:Na+/H+ antiporter NhaA [Spirochaetota bacterium]
MKQSFIKNLFNEFFESEKTAGIVLIFCTIVSLIVANSILGDHYIDFWHRKLNLS